MECQEILEDCLPLSTVSMYLAYSPVLLEGTSAALMNWLAGLRQNLA